MLAIYQAGGFMVRYMLMNGEFETYKDDLAGGKRRVMLNVTSNEEHVGDIERYIRTIKERVRMQCLQIAAIQADPKPYDD